MFLDKHTFGIAVLKIRVIVLLDTLRTFRCFVTGTVRSRPGRVAITSPELGKRLAHPEYARFFLRRLGGGSSLIRTAKADDVKVLLMTYPLNPPTCGSRLSGTGWRMKRTFPLLRNDVIFRELAQRGTLDQYLLHDHWHPNGRGYQLVTGNVARLHHRHDPRPRLSASTSRRVQGPPTSGVEMASSGR